MHIAIYPDTNILSHEAAQYIVRVAQESIVTHGRFTLALSGGNTPKKLYGLLATEPYVSQIDWNLVEIFWSDERCVPPDSPDSNYRMAQEVLLSKVPIQKDILPRFFHIRHHCTNNNVWSCRSAFPNHHLHA
jgi:6-phosphogluconolactonase